MGALNISLPAMVAPASNPRFGGQRDRRPTVLQSARPAVVLSWHVFSVPAYSVEHILLDDVL